jgi:prepilin-type N-terminal cleavage/methylation domain-containing protein/prepilin-type processing-associated H-X9-DG protein
MISFSTSRLPTSLRSSAFTLIELLTVIAVIGILAAILIPVVGKVRDSARRAACASNLRQIGQAMHLYHDDHGHFPNQNDGSYVTLAGQRGSGAGPGGSYTTPADRRPLNPYLGVADHPDAVVEITRCPSDNVMWEASGSSYAYGNIYEYLVRQPGGAGVPLEQIQNPSRVLMAYEVNAALMARGQNAPAQYDFHERERYNVVYADGHVSFLRIYPNRLVSDEYSFFWNR